VFRLVFSVLFLATFAASAQETAQAPAQNPAESVLASGVPQSVAPQVAEAEAAIAKSDWNTAETALNPWLASNPSDARALFDAGYVADAQNRPTDAISFYRRAIAADPKSFVAHLSLGLLLARQGNAEDARPELAIATNLDPGDLGPAVKARAWRALARIDEAGIKGVGDPAEASNDLIEALKISPETPADTLLAANLAEQAGQWDAAEKAYRRVLANNPNDQKSTVAASGLAHVLIVRKQYPEAETLLRSALQQSPDDPALTAQLATVLASQDKAEALPLIQKLHDAHPDDPAITRMLAAVLADSGDYSGSDHYYIKLLAAKPNDPELLVSEGQNLVHLLRYADAYAVFNKASQLDQANAEAWSGLAFAASRTGHPDVTLHALTMRSKFLPEVPTTYFLWATAYDSLHQKEQAAAYYKLFLEASAGKFPDQEWQARQRIKLLGQKP